MTITNSKTAGDVVCDLLRRVRKPSICVALLLMFVLCGVESATAQNFRRGDKQMVSGGILQEVEPSEQDTIVLSRADSLNRLKMLAKQARQRADSIARYERRRQRAIEQDRIDADGNIIPPEPWFGDSVSLSRMCWTSALLPGYGQIYNKQYWKLPILYGTLGASIGFAIHQNSIYKPLKKEYDALILENGLMRTEELNLVQRKMIRSNTTRQLLWGAAVASYIYFLGDAAVNYSTNEVSNVKKATTLSLICPGAGQIYNKSYWRAPIVVGGLASMIYVIDWNNRGFQRFKKAYTLRADYDQNPDKYPNGPADEFGGRYSTTFLKNLRDSNRRNRDLSILLTAGIYVFQAIDAHVDAHLKDFDVSDNLTVDLKPMFDCQYTYHNGATPIFGFDLNVTF